MLKFFRNAVVIFFSVLISLTSTAQLTYNITVNGPNQSPMAGVEIVLVETSTFVRTVYKTNPQGKLALVLNESDGKKWMMNVGEMYNYTILELSPGATASGSATVSYDVARWNRQNELPVDRKTIELEDIPQRIASNAMPGAGEELVELLVVSKGGRPFFGTPVNMTSYALGVSYSTTTDEHGVARFMLPLNEKFQIDLDGEDDFSFHDTGSKSAINRITLFYEKINFKEEENADGYLEQTFLEVPKPVSNRVMVVLNIIGGPNDGIEEDLYLQTDYSSKKYYAKTNSEGKAVFLLPKKKTYHLSFNFQKDAGVVDLSKFFGIGYSVLTFRYNPDPRLQFPENYLPTKNDVKSYDINNYVTQRYPDTPDEELVNVHVKWGNTKINSGSLEALLELGFSIKEPTNKQAISKPLNIAFVLDKSGSMSGPNIDLLKSAMLDFISKLRPEDRVSIVFFDTEAVLAYGEVNINKPHLEDVIRAVQADGGTNIYEGLKMGYEVVEKNKLSNSVNRVILLTDGYCQNPVDLTVDLSKNYFNKGISVSTIGVGSAYNQALLTLLSQYSGGLVHQAVESEGISIALEKEFESLVYPIASDLRVKVTYNDRVIYKTLFGIPEKSNSDHTVVFELPKVFSSLNQMALMKFKIENPDRDIDKNKIKIETTYFDEIKQQEISIVKETNLEWTDETDAEMIQDAYMKNIYSMAVINQAYKVIADYCDSKNYTAAKALINETLKSLKVINGEKYSEDLIPLIEELKQTLIYLDRVIMKQ
jgi:Ca-activated chloride channel family protein